MSSETPPAGDAARSAAPAPAARVTGTPGQPAQGQPAPRSASPAALITGCSTGIGHATALRLHAAGFTVYATARQPESLAGLAAAGITTLRLDITDEASMTAMVGRITAGHGGVAVLVNNAGFELAGPIEEVPPAEARRQFEAKPTPACTRI